METAIFFLIIISAIIIGSILYSVYKKRRFSIYFSRIAQEYGIRFTEGSFLRFPSVSGIIDSYPIQIEKYSFSYSNKNIQTLKFTVDIQKRNLPPFSISAESFVSQVKKVFGYSIMGMA